MQAITNEFCLDRDDYKPGDIIALHRRTMGFFNEPRAPLELKIIRLIGLSQFGEGARMPWRYECEFVDEKEGLLWSLYSVASLKGTCERVEPDVEIDAYGRDCDGRLHPDCR